MAGPNFADGMTARDDYGVVSPVMTAIKQDCIAKCNSMKDCKNIAFVPKENRCYLRSNIISDTAPQIALKDGYTLFKHWKPGICSVFVYYDA